MGKMIDLGLVNEAMRLVREEGLSPNAAGRRVGIDPFTVRKYLRKLEPVNEGPLVANDLSFAAQLPPGLPLPAAEAGGPSLPEPAKLDYAPFDTQLAGAWGIISDVHIPYHDLGTVKAFVDECRSRNVVGILLNGDVLDCYQLSDHVKDPSAPRMREEIDKGRQLLEYLRATFPKARIVYKEGNHDERLKRYLATRAADLFDLDDVHLKILLRAEQFGVEWVADKRLVMLGKLPVIHGHEYQGGGGVMPARWLYLRTGASAVCGHFHQPTFYSFRTIEGKEVGMWSTGCACHLSPAYRPLNQWRHGFAVVDVAADKSYHVTNRQRLKDGRIA